MYQEISKRKKISFLHLFGSILLLVIVLLIFNAFVSLLDVNSTLLDLAWLIIAVIFTYQYIKRNIISYKYMLIDEEFIVQEMIGSKEKPVLNINVHQIVESDYLDSDSFEAVKKGQFKARRKLYNSGRHHRKRYFVYEEDMDRYLVILQLSEKMSAMIDERSENV